MAGQLKGKRIAALVANGFEQIELTEPRRALEGEGGPRRKARESQFRRYQRRRSPGRW